MFSTVQLSQITLNPSYHEYIIVMRPTSLIDDLHLRNTIRQHLKRRTAGQILDLVMQELRSSLSGMFHTSHLGRISLRHEFSPTLASRLNSTTRRENLSDSAYIGSEWPMR